MGTFYLNVVLTARDNNGDSTTKLVVAQISSQDGSSLTPIGFDFSTINGVPISLIHQQSSSSDQSTTVTTTTTTTTTKKTNNGKPV